MNDDFEQHLQRQPPRQIPRTWRTEILAAARPARASRWQEWLATFNLQPATLFRWSALAAVWVVIFALNHASRDASPVVMAKLPPPSPQMVLALREQRKLLSELEQPGEAPAADRQKPARPGPHSQRRTERVTA
jgi:hypothetical protein